jgi:adenylate cyclase
MTELELTFLVRSIPEEIARTKPTTLTDVYIPENSDFPVLRLRQRNQEYEITKKVPSEAGDYSVHTEQTIPLDTAEYLSLRRASKRTITKDRYTAIIDGQKTELDVFKDRLAGLVIADFEFDNETSMKSFRAPSWCLADVTQEKFILGGQLAGRSLQDIRLELDDYGYKPVFIK